MAKNVFVLGMTEVHKGELSTVRDSDNCNFRNLLDYDNVVADAEVDVKDLLARARAQLDDFDGRIDAIVVHWDFPVSIIGPLLAREYGLPAPSLESLLKCEHKYWSRLEQQEAVPECVPKFASFDPFDDNALSTIDVSYPFWVKPVKAHSSSMGFEIHDEAQFRDAIAEIRQEIEQVGDAFNEVLDMVDLPEAIREADGNTCLAEQFVAGTQAAVEGTLHNGEFHAHGVLDMHKDADGTSFERLDYPADSVPDHVQKQMIDISERFMHHIGFDNGCFNSEFIWDSDTGKLWLIEFNTRISQAHSDLFAKVDGVSNHEVAIDVALGRKPQMPYRKGNFAVASQCMVFHDGDAVVTRVPTDEEKERIRRRYPETTVTLKVEQGDRLSEVPHQDSYRYIVARLYIGGDDREQVVERFKAITAELPLEFAEVEEAT